MSTPMGFALVSATLFVSMAPRHFEHNFSSGSLDAVWTLLMTANTPLVRRASLIFSNAENRSRYSADTAVGLVIAEPAIGTLMAALLFGLIAGHLLAITSDSGLPALMSALDTFSVLDDA